MCIYENNYNCNFKNFFLKQLSKKIEKLKNDNETLKQKVILSNKEKENKSK